MSLLLARIARSLSHHWIRGLVGAFVVLIALGAVSQVGGEAVDDFSTPGTESQKAIDLFQEHTPALAGVEATIVFHTDEGKITDPEQKAAVQETLAKIKALPEKKIISDPFAEGGTISPDGKLAAADVRWTMDPSLVKAEDGRPVVEAVEAQDGKAGVEVSARGAMIDIGSEQELPVGELVGIGIAIILLWVLFRSKVAMLVTLLGALLGVFLGQMLLAALSKPLGLPSFAAFIATMLGLGAGIDYALLIVGRYREQVAKGDSPRDAAAKSAATSGASVVAAGLIVMLAIAGLLVIGIPFIGKLGVGAAIAVGGVVLSALTVLMALIGAFKKWLTPKNPESVKPSAAFERWGERVTARPWLSIGAGVLIMLIFAAPVTQLRLGQPDDGNQPEGKLQRVAYDRLSAAFGPGSNGTFIIAADTQGGAQAVQADLDKLQKAIAGTAGVAQAAPPTPSEDGEMATIFAIPKSAPQDEATSQLLERLREDTIPAATQGTPLAGKVFIGGAVPVFEDLSAKVASRLPVFILTVIGLSVLLLIMAFRSLWIPLVSALFNLLSVLAAYGVVVAVFQMGIGASLVGSDSDVPIVSFIPVMLFAILFGLSMDYNVFLLSRVHEAYNEGDRPRESVIHGMSRIGKVILFAGLIMAAVFLAFVTQPDVVGKMMGLGLGLAILIDVLFVRLVIAPAVVTLLGDKAWWLPGWLDRILPNVSLEGHLVEGLDKQLTSEHDAVDSTNGHGGAPERETTSSRQ
ncbi:RND superfamily putative drug exporter [Solirubrobacter pauli]|uniref:RND superfamily putative drug exporter n=1 Tax=Solirubrobacter pauli TaxID=166793 RepID=A0A660L497_9ACTN|nr:MMPL family transporter [Solirubrobacter pauli]RKQ86733.1 RND superfamily putative drug exporter [Solirubrobacter pauli]